MTKQQRQYLERDLATYRQNRANKMLMGLDTEKEEKKIAEIKALLNE